MDYVGVVEAAYRLEHPLDEWLDGVLEASSEWLDHGLGCFGHVFRAEGEHLRVRSVSTRGALAGMEELIKFSSENAPIDVVQTMFRAGIQAGSAIEVLERDGLAEDFKQLISSSTGGAMQDQVGVVAGDDEGGGVALSGGRPARASLHASSQARWTRLAVHIGAGCRLAGTLAESLESGSDAILTPEGEVKHAVGEAKTKLGHLRRAVMASERARGPLRKQDPDEALDLWQGLVDGRWSLVDRFEKDGRRFVVAYRNQAEHVDPRGLTQHEHFVCEHLGLGRSSKQIAYEMGISASAVSNVMGRCRKKLGLGSSAELAAFFSPGGPRAHLTRFALSGEDFAVGSTSKLELEGLSEAEREVTLELLQGATNEHIARHRGTQTRTVANQVASIFAKLGVNSRVELAAHLHAGLPSRR